MNCKSLDWTLFNVKVEVGTRKGKGLHLSDKILENSDFFGVSGVLTYSQQ